MGRRKVMKAVVTKEPGFLFLLQELSSLSLKDRVRRRGDNGLPLSVDTFSLVKTHSVSSWMAPWLRSDDNVSKTTSGVYSFAWGQSVSKRTILNFA